MPWNPTPVIAVGEFPLCEPRRDAEGRTLFDGQQRTLVGEAALDWGRKDPWTQPEPATLRFTVFDPSRWWIDKVKHRNAVGIGCTLTVPIPNGINRPDMPSGVLTMFQGFVSNVRVTEHRARTTTGTVDGHLVEITAADRTSMLGNIMFSHEDWGAERMIDRAVRIRNRAAGVGIREFYYDAAYKEAAVTPTEVRDETALSLLQELYKSFGHQWTYSPNRNVVIRIPEHKFAASPVFCANAETHEVIVRMPDIADSTGEELAIDRAPHAGTGVDGAVTSAEVELDSDSIEGITAVDMKWRNVHDNYRTIITRVFLTGSVEPRRTLTFDSWFADGVHVDPIISRTADKAFWSQAGPHHPEIHLDTRLTGGFASVTQGIALLSATEARGYIYVNGSPWFEALGTLPVGAPCGGRITYHRGRWRVSTRLLATRSTTAGGQLRWDQLDRRIYFGHPRHTAGALQFGGVHWWDMYYPTVPNIYVM